MIGCWKRCLSKKSIGAIRSDVFFFFSYRSNLLKCLSFCYVATNWNPRKGFYLCIQNTFRILFWKKTRSQEQINFTFFKSSRPTVIMYKVNMRVNWWKYWRNRFIKLTTKCGKLNYVFGCMHYSRFLQFSFNV